MDKKYLKLLALQRDLEKKGQFIPHEKRDQLLKYNVRLTEHFRWEPKNNFIEVMVDLLTDKTNIDQYVDQFREIDARSEKAKQKLLSDFQRLETFEPDVQSIGFGILIENLMSDIRLLEPDDSVKTSDEISPEDLIIGIQEFLPKIQEY